MPKPTEWAYLAGLLDGEAYFSANEVNGRAAIRVEMNTGDVLNWCQHHFNGHLYRLKPHAQSTVDESWRWDVNRLDDLETILRRTLPHLKVKHREAEAMYALVKHSKRKPEVGSGAKAWVAWRAERRRLLRAIKEHREVPK